ncbi:Coiled-coil domain-containing protein 96 [Channa argus]|uniref:Coiled-coil domain-containing protein 96 n=2 Tax=Channa argus TaxID=215402 RepID=A0A6G1Q4J5_CHAAH|nr:Coiled-coil domain-containing protein 96 [Channa argus]
MAVSDHREENPEEFVIEAVNSDPEENIEKGLHGVDMTASQHLDLKLSEVSEQPLSREEKVGFDINSSYDDETITLAKEEVDESDEEESSVSAPDKAEISYEEHMKLLQELCEERDKALQRGSQLQTKLAEYLHKKAGDIAQLERQVQASEQLQEYEKCINILNDLKQQLAADTETVQQQAEELRLQCQEKLETVENEWRAFMSLKQDVAVTVLSRRLGKQAAQAKVVATLAAEQLRQDQLIQLRLKNIKLKFRIHRLEAELRDEDEHGRDPLQLQFEKLQTQRLEQKQQIERQSEELVKLQKKISGSLELLSNVKEKLYWNQMEVVAKREQLAEVEAMVARKRDLLTRTKKACNSLQRDNQRLKERRGLLGNRLLLRDFEDTVDASTKLEEQLNNLKCRQTEIAISCGRWKKNE